MTLSRPYLIGALAALAVAGLIGYFAFIQTSDEYKYRGLQTTMEVQMPNEIRNLILQRIKVTEAGIEAWGDEVDIDMYVSLAGDAVLVGDLIKAREAAEAAVNANPLNYATWNLLGTIAEDMYDYDTAREAYRNAVDLSPGIEEFYRDYIFLVQEHWPEDRQDIRDVLEASIEDMGRGIWNMTQLAKWYEQEGDCDQVEAHYEVALDIEPDNADVRNALNAARETCIETP